MLPPALHGTAFLATDAHVAHLGAKRLRAADVDRPYRGVRSVGLDLGSTLDRCRAYEPQLRRGQVFSHATAALLYRMPLPRALEGAAVLHVSVLDDQNRPRGRGIVGHRLAHGKVTAREHRGLPVSDVVSTWCQLASVLAVDDLVAVGDFIVSGRVVAGAAREPPLATIEELAGGLRQWVGRRGARRLAAAIDFVRCGVDSRPESLLRMLLIRAGLPEPAINLAAFDARGGRLGRPDLSYPTLLIAFEYEGDHHRSDPNTFRYDIFRHELFEDAGWRVFRVTWDDLRVDPEGFLRRARRTVIERSAQLGMPASGPGFEKARERA
jgi:hypothetical protein